MLHFPFSLLVGPRGPFILFLTLSSGFQLKKTAWSFDGATVIALFAKAREFDFRIAFFVLEAVQSADSCRLLSIPFQPSFLDHRPGILLPISHHPFLLGLSFFFFFLSAFHPPEPARFSVSLFLCRRYRTFRTFSFSFLPMHGSTIPALPTLP